MEQANGLASGRAGVKALTIALVAGVAWLLFPYLSGLIGAMVLYIVAAPIVDWIAARSGPIARRRLAAIAAVLLLFFVLVLPGIWLAVQLVAQVPDVSTSLQGSAFVQRITAARVGSLNIGAELQRLTSDILRWSSRQTLAALGGALSATMNLVIALFGAYYLLVGADRLWTRCRPLLPFCPTTAELLRMRFHRVTEAMLLGVVTTCVAQGLLVSIAFAIAGFEHVLLWGAITAIFAILPLFGSAFVWGPGVLVLAAHDRYTAATVMLVFGALVISNIDNVLRLVVYRRVSHIHPMVTLVGALAGVKAFGSAGLLMGPLVLSYAIELLRIHEVTMPAVNSAVDGQGIPRAASGVLPTLATPATPTV